MKHSFGSDNHSGVHPLILESINRINQDYASSYGEDPYSLEILSRIESMFDDKYHAYFVLTGTGANVLALSALTTSINSILCPVSAHINVDECGSPEKFTGCKLIPIPAKDGKVTPDDVLPFLTGFGFQHHSQPKVLSISQSTELGTVYTPAEISELKQLMSSYGCYIHVDGSRLTNASAYLDLPMKAFTSDLDVDAFSISGTKNGLLMGEVLLVSKNINSDSLKYLRKQLTQLYSKSRFMAAQFEAFLNDDLWLKMATHSNEMAQYLKSRIEEVPSVKITRPVESNAVFAIISDSAYKKLIEKHYFYIWDEQTMEVRWMTSFTTQKEDIDNFINDLLNT